MKRQQAEEALAMATKAGLQLQLILEPWSPCFPSFDQKRKQEEEELARLAAEAEVGPITSCSCRF